MTRLPAGGGAEFRIVPDDDQIVGRADPGGIDLNVDVDAEKSGDGVDDGAEPGASTAADVVDFAGAPGPEQPVIGVGHVAHIQKVADDFDVADVENPAAVVAGELHQLTDEGGDDEGVALSGADMVEGAGDDDIQPVTVCVEARKQLLRDSGDGVGVVGVEFILFAERHFFRRIIAVLLGGPDREESGFQAEAVQCFDDVEKDVGVVDKAFDRLLPAGGDGAHGSEVDDPVRGKFCEKRGEALLVDEVEPPVADPQALPRADGRDIDAEEFGVGFPLQEMADQMLRDESADAGDQNFSHTAI